MGCFFDRHDKAPRIRSHGKLPFVLIAANPSRQAQKNRPKAVFPYPKNDQTNSSFFLALSFSNFGGSKRLPYFFDSSLARDEALHAPMVDARKHTAQMQRSGYLSLYWLSFGGATMFIENITKALHDHNVTFAVVGGYAVALHGAVRGTVDLDLVLEWNRNNLDKAVQTLQHLGFKSHLPLDTHTVFEQRESLIRDKNLIAWNFYNPHNLAEQVDLIINFDLTTRTVTNIPIGTTNIPVLNKHDLINMKEKSGRPQDLADIAALRSLP